MGNLSSLSKFYRTNDATATIDDIAPGKSAYVNGGKVTAPDSALFRDNGIDSDGTLLSAHTPDIDLDGGGWLGSPTQFEIVNNRIENIGGVVQAVWAEMNTEHHVITGILRLHSGGNTTGLLGRVVDASNFWLVLIDILGLNEFAIWRNTGGGWAKEVSSSAQTFAADVDYPATLEFHDNNVIATVNGETLVKVSTVHNTATKAGFRIGDISNGGSVRDFRVVGTND